jgi:hypothetical protein
VSRHTGAAVCSTSATIAQQELVPFERVDRRGDRPAAEAEPLVGRARAFGRSQREPVAA